MGSVKLTNRILAFFIDLIFLIIVINIFQNMIDFNALEFQFGQIGRFDISLNFAPPIVWAWLPMKKLKNNFYLIYIYRTSNIKCQS